MEIRLSQEQEACIAALAAQTGRSIDEVVVEALAAWAEQETTLAAFRASLDAAEDAIARGEGRPITRASMRSLADEVKRKGRERAAISSATHD